MPEVPKPHPERPRTTFSYEQFLQRSIEHSLGVDTPGSVGGWYKEMHIRMPDLTVRPETELAGNALRVIKEGEQIARIDANDGQRVFGYSVTRTNPNGKVFSWHQPGIQKERHMLQLPTMRGEKVPFRATDMVVVIRDANTGDILLHPKQEPFARTPKHMVIDTPIRGSAKELQTLLDGKETGTGFGEFMKAVGGGKSIRELVREGNISFFATPLSDANRTTEKPVGMVINVQGGMREKLTENTTARWCTKEDITMLQPVLSGPAAAALFAYQGGSIAAYLADHADAWFEDRLTKIGGLDAKLAPTVTDGKSWKVTPAGEKDSAVTGAHFTLKRFVEETQTQDGKHIEREALGLVQTETPLTFPLDDAEISMQASGVLGLIKDTRGRVLLTIEPEPFVVDPALEENERTRVGSYEKRGLIRTMQFSTQKLADLIEGKPVDEGLKNFFDTVTPEGKNIHDLFESGVFDVAVLPPADPGTISATNLLVTMTVDDPVKQDTLVQDGSRRWFTLDEAKVLAYRGKVNGHTAAALMAA